MSEITYKVSRLTKAAQGNIPDNITEIGGIQLPK